MTAVFLFCNFDIALFFLTHPKGRMYPNTLRPSLKEIDFPEH